MSWTFKQAKFKVGDCVHFPYGRKIGTITHVDVAGGNDAGFPLPYNVVHIDGESIEKSQETELVMQPEELVDADGFRLLKCKSCEETKLAALFSPSSIVSGRLWCIKCGSTCSKESARYAQSPPSREIWSGGMKVIQHQGRLEPLFGGKTRKG